MATISIISVVFATLYTQYLKGSLVTDRLEENKKNLKNEVLNFISKKTDIAITNALAISNSDTIAESLISEDRELAIGYLNGIGDRYKMSSNFKGIKVHIHTKDFKSFVRSHKPDKFGDDLSTFRKSIVDVKATKKPFIGFELGRIGLMIRAVVPIMSEGDYVGSLEFIQGVGSVHRDFKRLEKDYIMLLKPKALEIATKVKSNKKVKEYYVANNKWFSDETINHVRKIDYDKLFKDGHYTTDKYLYTYIPIKDIHNNEIAFHLIGEKLSVFESAIDRISSVSWSFIVMIIVLSLIIIITTFFSIDSLIIKPLRDIVVSLKSGSHQVRTSSEELNKVSMNLSDMAVQQITSVEDVNEILEETTQNLEQSTTNTREADKLSLDSKNTADKGYAYIQDLIVSMDGINKSSAEISNIIKTIDEIAFQTNLLALNAAVEAARAGEHGLGFAVVAEEVRNLAGKSAEAARETTDIIQNSLEEVKKGTKIANETNEAFNEIVEKINRTNSLISEVSLASTEQIEGINRIKSSIVQVDNIAQSVASISEESSASAEELKNQSNTTLSSVEEISKMVSTQG
jgi:methyl-accepting chemotaxis protein